MVPSGKINKDKELTGPSIKDIYCGTVSGLFCYIFSLFLLSGLSLDLLLFWRPDTGKDRKE
jgi:hypothetical protein